MNTNFPEGKNPPIHPNTDFFFNCLALCPPGLPKASSPLIREAWNLFLTDYPECKFVSGLLNIIDVGASIGHLGLPISQSCKNIRSSIDHPNIISKEINYKGKYMAFYGAAAAPLPLFAAGDVNPQAQPQTTHFESLFMA